MGRDTTRSQRGHSASEIIERHEGVRAATAVVEMELIGQLGLSDWVVPSVSKGEDSRRYTQINPLGSHAGGQSISRSNVEGTPSKRGQSFTRWGSQEECPEAGLSANYMGTG